MFTGKWGILMSKLILFWTFSVVIKICSCQSNDGKTEVVSQNTNNLAPPSYNDYGPQHPTFSYYYPDYYGYYDQANYQAWLNSYMYWLLMRRQFEDTNLYTLEHPRSVIKKPLEIEKEKTEYDQLLNETLEKYRNILQNYSSHIKELNKLISKPKEETVKDSSVDSVKSLEKDSSVEKIDIPDYSSEYYKTGPYLSETTEYFAVSPFEDVSEKTELNNLVVESTEQFGEQTTDVPFFNSKMTTEYFKTIKTTKYEGTLNDKYMPTEEYKATTNKDEVLDVEKFCVYKECVKPTGPIGGFQNNNTLDAKNDRNSKESTEVNENNISFSPATILYYDLYLKKNEDTTEQNTKVSVPTEERHTDNEYSTESCYAKQSSNENCHLQGATEDSLPADKYLKYLHTTLGNIETTTECQDEAMATTDLDTNVLQCKDCAELDEIRDTMKRIRLVGLLFLDMGHLLLNEDSRFPIVPKVVEHAKKHG